MQNEIPFSSKNHANKPKELLPLFMDEKFIKTVQNINKFILGIDQGSKDIQLNQLRITESTLGEYQNLITIPHEQRADKALELIKNYIGENNNKVSNQQKKQLSYLNGMAFSILQFCVSTKTRFDEKYNWINEELKNEKCGKEFLDGYAISNTHSIEIEGDLLYKTTKNINEYGLLGQKIVERTQEHNRAFKDSQKPSTIIRILAVFGLYDSNEIKNQH